MVLTERISGFRDRVRVRGKAMKWLFRAYISSTPAFSILMRISSLARFQTQVNILPLFWKLIIRATVSLPDARIDA